MGTIEFHGWGSLARAVEKPDRMVFDLDPDEGLGFEDVKAAALEIRQRLGAKGLESFAMLTGGKGVHVVVPLVPGHSWAAHRAFAKSFAAALADNLPQRFTTALPKAKRAGKIFVDYLRNQRGSTAVMPWSARARAGAPVAAPVAWDELAGFESARAFTIRDAARLLERAEGEALKGWGEAAQALPEA
jgi:bifunctional non-homologous end joining protein LigD